MRPLPDPIPIPIAKLPLNKAGYPIPWFVDVTHGEPDFRVVRGDGIAVAYNQKLCWICGETRSGMDAFVIGPMCAINRVSAEPPSHLNCARWAAIACPFLANPGMVRREGGLPEDRTAPPGQMIARNPGVALVWGVRGHDWEPFAAGNGVLFDVGEPRLTEWYARGRRATHDEVLASITSGYPTLVEAAVQDGPHAIEMLNAQLNKALELVP